MTAKEWAAARSFPPSANPRPVWRDDYGAFRIGRTGDMIQMLDDLGIPDRAF